MKKTILKGLILLGFIATIGLTVSVATVNAESVYDQASKGYGSAETLVQDRFTLQEMLTYAIQDEYMAQAEYQAIIGQFGEIRPFENIIQAEVNHISLLVPLFEKHGYAVPSNEAQGNVVLPETITSAIATGFQAEKMNIAMYAKFLSQSDLPEDVRNTFTYLMNASIQHQNAFAKDRYSGVVSDVMNQFRNRFQFKNKNQNQNRLQNQSSINCPNQ